MNKLLINILVFAGCIFSLSCNPRKIDEKLKAVKTIDTDTFYLDSHSKLTINRFRQFLRKTDYLKLGKTGIHFTPDSMITKAEINYSLDSGILVVSDKYLTGMCYFNKNKVIVPIKDSTRQLQLGVPGYLLKSSNPDIGFEYKANLYPPGQQHAASCYLHINDTVGLLKDSHTKINYLQNKKNYRVQTTAYINGLQWGLFESHNVDAFSKDSIMILIDAVFHAKPASHPAKKD